jgi:hypothetical protein
MSLKIVEILHFERVSLPVSHESTQRRVAADVSNLFACPLSIYGAAQPTAFTGNI